MEKRLKTRFWVMTAMIVAAGILRIAPHPPNVAPITAMALFAGAHFDRKGFAFAVPLLAMFLSDAVLELIYGWGFHTYMLSVYGTFGAIVCLGFLLRNNKKPLRVMGSALVASTTFYVVTNLAAWASSPLYPRSVEGLIACYVAGIPFFGHTAVGDLFYTGVLFSAFAVAKHRFPVLAAPRAQEI